MNSICSKCGGPVEAGGNCPRCLLRVAMGDSALTPAPSGTGAAAGETVKSPTPHEVPFAQPVDSHVVPPIDLAAPSAAITPTVKSPTPGSTVPLGTPPGGAADSQPPTRLRGLEILESLGRGGMGQVYRARQIELDRIVAVKVLPSKLAEDPEFVQRFKREAKALAALDHPNIVRVYDCGVEEDHTFLVMEFVDGPNLRDLMRRGLTAEQALALVPPICEALEYAHGEGVVHRDIKPENILVDRRGRVKIADFGLAKILRAGAPNLTQSREVMGTPHYMAPEQFERPKEVDHRADIYALGVVFYEMLTGELPIGRFQPPSQRVQVDVRLDEVVLKALEKDPGRRYQHASEMNSEVTRVSTPLPGGAGLRSLPVPVGATGPGVTQCSATLPPAPGGRSVPAVPPVPPVPPGARPLSPSCPTEIPAAKKAIDWATASLGLIAVAAVFVIVLGSFLGSWFVGMASWVAVPVMALLGFSLLDESFRRSVYENVSVGIGRVAPQTPLEPAWRHLQAARDDPGSGALRAAIPLLAIGAFMFVFSWAMGVTARSSTLWAFEAFGLVLMALGLGSLCLHTPFRTWSAQHPASWAVLPGALGLTVLLFEKLPGPRLISYEGMRSVAFGCSALGNIAGLILIGKRRFGEGSLALSLAIITGFIATTRRVEVPTPYPMSAYDASEEEFSESDIEDARAHLFAVTFEPPVSQLQLQMALGAVEDRGLITRALRDIRGSSDGPQSAEDQAVGDIFGHLDTRILTGINTVTTYGASPDVNLEPYTIGFFILELRDYSEYLKGKVPCDMVGRKIIEFARRKWESDGLRLRSITLYELRKRKDFDISSEPVWPGPGEKAVSPGRETAAPLPSPDPIVLLASSDPARWTEAADALIRKWPDGRPALLKAKEDDDEDLADRAQAILDDYDLMDRLKSWGAKSVSYWSVAWDLRHLSQPHFRLLYETVTGDRTAVDGMELDLDLAQAVLSSFMTSWNEVWKTDDEKTAHDLGEQRIRKCGVAIAPGLMLILDADMEEAFGRVTVEPFRSVYDREITARDQVKALHAIAWLKRPETVELVARQLRSPSMTARKVAAETLESITGQKVEEGQPVPEIGMYADLLWWEKHRDDYLERWEEQFRVEGH